MSLFNGFDPQEAVELEGAAGETGGHVQFHDGGGNQFQITLQLHLGAPVDVVEQNYYPTVAGANSSPQLLPEVPIDPFSGKPMKYRSKNDKWIVYSFGKNGKDDQGKGRSWPGGPDLVFRSSIKSNIQKRSEVGETFTAQD